MNCTTYANIVDSMALPRMVWLRPNLIGLAFPLMKLLPARFIIQRAIEEGELEKGDPITESTSGTFGLALAMVARLRGHPLTLVSDPAIEPPLQRRLEDLGAAIHICREPAPLGGYQRARLDVLERILNENRRCFWPRQYSNLHNPESYAPCAEQLTRAVGAIDCLIGTTGSGGSMCGISSFLRLLFPSLTVIGVDTHGSVIFGQSDKGAGRMLRGLGNSVMPPILDHSAFDWVHWLGAADAFRATRRLHQEHALFMGPTSGAAYKVADWWARRNRDGLAAVILPDEGSRYENTVYNDAWLNQKGIELNVDAGLPVEWDHPRDGFESWSCCHWARRTQNTISPELTLALR